MVIKVPSESVDVCNGVKGGISRRDFLKHTGIAATILPLLGIPSFARALTDVPDGPRANPDPLSFLRNDSLTLNYPQAAQESEILQQGLAIGNGRMGALVGGDPQRECLYLSDASMWLGGRNDALNTLGYFPYERDNFGSFVMLARLYVDIEGHAMSSLQNYQRALDLGNGILQVSYTKDGTHYMRTVFASHPDDAIVIHLSAQGPGRYDGQLELCSAHNDTVTVESKPGGVGFDGRFDNNLRYGAVAQATGEDGHVSHLGNKVSFKGCRELTIVFCGGSNYEPNIDCGYMDANMDPRQLARARVNRAMAVPFPVLLQNHVVDYRQLFDRMTVDLGASTPAQRQLDTWQRLKARAKTGAQPDPELEASYLQFGRYLTIAGSRGGLPTNLQGLWLSGNRPPWRADYHTDINLEMNYWLPDRSGISSCFDPLTQYCLSQYPSWKKLTQEHFNDPRNSFRNTSGKVAGWTVAFSLNIYGGEGWWWHPASNAWLCNNLWQHYQYTQNADHLKTIYPLMKGACQFWEARLIETEVTDEVTGKSHTVWVDDHDWSPEQGPTNERGITYAQEAVWDLFEHYQQATRLLMVDQAYSQSIATMQSRLYLPHVSPQTGRLEEWMSPKDLGTPTHRHLSPLFGFFPGDRITVDNSNPDVISGVKRLLEARGMHSYGWANAWRGICWARLKDGDKAYQLVMNNLEPALKHGGTAPNFFNIDYTPDNAGAYNYYNYKPAHKADKESHLIEDNPNHDGNPIFQIDANYGTPTAMLEMLLYSRPGRIEVLPALPTAWAAKGKVTGIGARGGFIVDIAWTEGHATHINVRSVGGTQTQLIANGRSHNISMRRGASAKVI